uniref:Uncharacterized protein n=1 Tax=Panagrolaimus superbus TaxID=310955 RepID=A0A914Z986_9BILA
MSFEDPPTKNGKREGTERFINGDDKSGDVSICAKIDEVGILSFISFGWVFNYLWKTYKGKSEPCTSWKCSIFDSANVNMSRLEVMWNEELIKKPNNPSLFRVILSFMKYRLILACIIFALCLCFGFIGPTCLVRGLIAFVEDPKRTDGGGIDYIFGAYIVGTMLLVEISRVLLYGACWAVSYRTGIRVRGAVLSLMYKHLMNARTQRNHTPSEIVNVCANDGQRLFDAVTFAPLVLVGPFVLVGGLIYLLKVIGWPSLAGIGVFFIFDVVQAILGVTMVRFRNRAIKQTEKRMNLMGEVIRCIRIIKMNAWEHLFINRINEVRAKEQHSLKVAGYAVSLAIATGTIVPVVATIVTVLVVVAVGSDLKASDAFSSVTVFFVMLFGIRMIPYGSRYLAEASQSIRKIQKMLLYPVYDDSLSLPRTRDVAVSFKNVKFSWDIVEEKPEKPSKKSKKKRAETVTEAEPLKSNEKNDFALNELNVTINKKELIGICGPVGSGKTSFLHSIAGQLSQESGDFSMSGASVLVSQVPCILNATVRENILFGLSMNTQRYYRSIQCSELTKDLEIMPRNEMTEVGERGVTLSGGQRARISLARALYASKDIYLLDDIFSSIDKQVADKIFEKAIQEFLENKTVLLVTSDAEYLSKCDRIIFFKDGQISGFETHEKLLEQSNEYKDFFEQYIQPTSYQSRVSSPEAGATNEDLNDEKKELMEESDKLADEEEDLGLQNISKSVYFEYIQAGGGWLIFALVLLAFFINVSSGIFSMFWLSKWMNDVHHDITLENGTIIHQSLAHQQDLSFYTTVYTCSLFILFFTGVFKAMIFVKVTLKAATNLHNRMLHSVLYGLTSFFDTTPTGRILNRFSKDMDEIDVKLPFSAEALLQNMIICVGFLIMIAYVFPTFLLACIPLFVIFTIFFLCFRAGIRSLKRTENILRSPLFSHVSSSLEGAVTIHSYSQTARFITDFKSMLDEHSGALFMFQSAMRWQAVWLDLLVVAVTFIVSSLIVVFTTSITPADAGMALAFALQMSGVFQFAVRSQTELESKLTAVERVSYYYKNIEQEDDESPDPPATWPRDGTITFDQVTLRYRQDATPALNNVSFEIPHGDKVGIVGRTGSGKSSLCNALFRLYPLESGKITISEKNISTISLKSLRKALAVIPQDPVIFAGTLRFNLDPDGIRTDEEIWKALEDVGMKESVSTFNEQLEFKLESNGSNISSGQRQLICVGRAFLRNVNILILDEATANLDSQTDKFIQQCIRTKANDKTLLLITHRLGNVTDMNRLLKVEDAKIKIEEQPSIYPSLEKQVSVEIPKIGNGTAPVEIIITEDNTKVEEEEDGEDAKDYETTKDNN